MIKLEKVKTERPCLSRKTRQPTPHEDTAWPRRTPTPAQPHPPPAPLQPGLRGESREPQVQCNRNRFLALHCSRLHWHVPSVLQPLQPAHHPHPTPAAACSMLLPSRRWPPNSRRAVRRPACVPAKRKKSRRDPDVASDRTYQSPGAQELVWSGRERCASLL